MDAVKVEPDITVSGFVNKLVKARLALGSIDDAVFRSFLISSFEGSVMDGYIKQVKNTDGISAKTIVQGLIDRSAEQEQLAKAKATKAERALAKVNMAIKHVEQCQLCGKKGHQALQCARLPRSVHTSIRTALATPATARRAEPKCDHCGQHGHTTARCLQLHQCFSCGKTGHFKDHCPEKTAAPTKPPAGYSKCKATADHYSKDCQAMPDYQAKVKLTHADIAVMAAEMGMQFEPEQTLAGWEDGPTRGV